MLTLDLPTVATVLGVAVYFLGYYIGSYLSDRTKAYYYKAGVDDTLRHVQAQYANSTRRGDVSGDGTHDEDNYNNNDDDDNINKNNSNNSTQSYGFNLTKNVEK